MSPVDLGKLFQSGIRMMLHTPNSIVRHFVPVSSALYALGTPADSLMIHLSRLRQPPVWRNALLWNVGGVSELMAGTLDGRGVARPLMTAT